MIVFILSLFFVNSAIAFPTPDTFDSTYFELEEIIHSETIKGKLKNATSALNTKLVNNILSDYENKIADDFIIPKYFDPSVRFWFSIYTQYNSKQVVIHDKANLSLVYHVIDFDQLHQSKIHRFAKSKLQTQLSLEYTRGLKKSLHTLSTKNFKKLSDQDMVTIKQIRAAGIKVPANKKQRKKLFLGLARNIRTQTGQRDMVYQGVIRSLPYQPFLNAQIDNFKLPRELLAISFLESSFNPKAISKVAASGVWQFMPYIGNLFLPRMDKSVDYRQNTIISTLGALHLLKQNKMILKRWDLAVPAYNSGTKHLVRARKKFRKKKDFSLAYVLQNYKHAHLGFASQNFYSSFLALVHTLAYKDVIYPLKGLKTNLIFQNPNDIAVYVSKCPVRPNTFFKAMKSSKMYIKDINSHFNYKNKVFPRGTLFVSDIELTSKRYYKLSNKELTKVFPKKYPRFSRNYKCR